VIIHNLDFVAVPVPPNKTDSPLLVNPDGILAFAAATQGLAIDFQAATKGREVPSTHEVVAISAARRAQKRETFCSADNETAPRVLCTRSSGSYVQHTTQYVLRRA